MPQRNQIPFFVSLVLLDLGLNPGLPDQWRILYSLGQCWSTLFIHLCTLKWFQGLLCNTNNSILQTGEWFHIFNTNHFIFPQLNGSKHPCILTLKQAVNQRFLLTGNNHVIDWKLWALWNDICRCPCEGCVSWRQCESEPICSHGECLQRQWPTTASSWIPHWLRSRRSAK